MRGTRAMSIGLAGEFRVMSELLLRGHNPAKSYLDTGTDIILENGLKLQIKTTIKAKRNNWGTIVYGFTLARGEKNTPIDITGFDFIICVIPDENLFYIIPSKSITSSLCLAITLSGKSRYDEYKNNWELLEGGK